MPLRLEPVDEYLHELGPETTFNESMYFNVYDPTEHVGGFVRLGNRANEGYAEMTTCLYLPDGRVGFMYHRPEISDNDAFAAGGMSFAVVEPFEELRVGYEGKVVMLEDPLEMADPRKAFTENHEREGEEFAKGHYEQLNAATGTITVGDQEWAVSGYGLRDHSWGPRTWQAPWYYRWLTANFGDDFGFMGSRIARPDREGMRGGFIWDGERILGCHHFEISTDWTETGTYHRAIEATLHHAEGSLNVKGKVLNLIPLRNRRDGMVTRISEGLTEWTLADGRVGYGLSEYLDQIVDDQPVGLAE